MESEMPPVMMEAIGKREEVTVLHPSPRFLKESVNWVSTEPLCQQMIHLVS